MTTAPIRTVFTLLRSEYNKSTGDRNWSRIMELSPIIMTSINISTDGFEQLIEVGNEPEIIPLGISSCEATCIGIFDDPNKHVDGLNRGSKIYPVSRLSMDIKLFSETIQLFDKVGDEEVTYAVKLGNSNRGGSRELEGGIWKIDKFGWDRKAKENGIYRFNMGLMYFWQDTSEQQIYDSSVGTKQLQICDFEAVVEPGGNNGQVADIFPIVNVEITRAQTQINLAEFDYTSKILKDSIIRIHKKSSTSTNDRNIFYGVVTECGSKTKDGLYHVSCKEIAELTYRGNCSEPSAGLLGFLSPRIKIPCMDSTGKFNIGFMAEQILKYYEPHDGFDYSPGTGFDKSNGLGKSNLIPGRDKVEIGDQILSSVSVGKAITSFLYKQCGLNIWYNYQKDGRLEYGFIRDPITIDITKEVIIETSLAESHQEDMKPDGVIVWSPDAEYLGYAGEIGPSKHVLVYQYTEAKNDIALEAIAFRILQYNNLADMKSYNVKFPAGVVHFKEGDYFTGLGDQTMPGDQDMVWRGGEDADPTVDPEDTVWQIKSVTITNKGTTVLVGPSYYSVLDIYRNALQRQKDGVDAPVETCILKMKEIQIGGNI